MNVKNLFKRKPSRKELEMQLAIYKSLPMQQHPIVLKKGELVKVCGKVTIQRNEFDAPIEYYEKCISREIVNHLVSFVDYKIIDECITGNKIMTGSVYVVPKGE